MIVSHDSCDCIREGQKLLEFDNMQTFESLSMRILLMLCLIVVALGTSIDVHSFAADPAVEGLPAADPESVGLLSTQLKYIDTAVNAAIGAGELPGAVVLVARHRKIAFLKAFGNRSVQPETETMAANTIFDMSSLTKVMATTPSVMQLVENGTLRLDDRVKRYLPKFTGGGKDAITVRQLLTHHSGLPPDFDLSRQWFGYPAALEELWKIATESESGKEFAYSDLNFIALGEIVRAVTGQNLDDFARKNIFVPLGMKETFFHPPQRFVTRIAPTESRRNTLQYLKGQTSQASLDHILRGEVHDPTAWRMEGVAGHAGLFSTARDSALFAQMLLDRGTNLQGVRVLSPMSVQAMAMQQSPQPSLQIRGYGWDIDSSYSSPRGDLFKEGFGHTGFTGTSLWVHPPTDLFILILSNRVHPDGGKDINHLRAVIANIVAAALADPAR
jgi:CubicO group peptidase (beta-lactamase class C family)